MEQDGGETDNIVVGPRSFRTLARSETARTQNEYIETPLRPQLPAPANRIKSEVCRTAITSQPTVKKDHNDSIICRQCGRCKCEACRNPRNLPSKWICSNKCLCSVSNVVDYCSCMCCVRGLFYHWAKDYEMDTDVSCADEPCSCAPHHRCLRWGSLSLLSLPLPCLCCYWPLRGCQKAGEGCYAKWTGEGCRCAPPHRTEKRLLDSDC